MHCASIQHFQLCVCRILSSLCLHGSFTPVKDLLIHAQRIHSQVEVKQWIGLKIKQSVQAVVDREECVAPVVTVTATLFGGFIVGIVLLYTYFTPHAGCSRNIAFVTVTWVLSLAISVLSVSSIRVDSAGLLTAVLISVYAVWLCASALYSAPVDHCSRLSLQHVSPEAGINWMTVRIH
jgi:hypothetical protein